MNHTFPYRHKSPAPPGSDVHYPCLPILLATAFCFSSPTGYPADTQTISNFTLAYSVQSSAVCPSVYACRAAHPLFRIVSLLSSFFAPPDDAHVIRPQERTHPDRRVSVTFRDGSRRLILPTGGCLHAERGLGKPAVSSRFRTGGYLIHPSPYVQLYPRGLSELSLSSSSVLVQCCRSPFFRVPPPGQLCLCLH